jgi:biotin transport system substrate-specific component
VLPMTVPTLVDTVPIQRPAVRVLTGIVAFAALTALAAQIRFNLPWTPVPITGQTFAVLLSGGVLGARAGAASQALYLFVGANGVPVYADWEGGWHAATGTTAGYLVGFVVAAAVVGSLAERRQDRSILTSVPAMLAGTAIIYVCGAWWLARQLGVSADKAIELGVSPFLIGDGVKLVLAGVALPVAWRLVGDRRD